MEIKGLATAVIVGLILNIFLPWLSLLRVTLTTHNDADTFCILAASVWAKLKWLSAF